MLGLGCQAMVNILGVGLLVAIGGFLTHRRCGGGIMAVFMGPLVGACLAWICIALGMLHSGDVGVLAAIGTGIGLLSGVAWGALPVRGGGGPDP